MSLAHFGYNLKRALAVAGLEKLLAALRQFQPSGSARGHLRKTGGARRLGICGDWASGVATG